MRLDVPDTHPRSIRQFSAVGEDRTGFRRHQTIMLEAMAEDATLSELLDMCRRDHRAWINGDGSGYELPAEGTILGAIGGYSKGGAETGRRQLAVASQWRCGSGSIEFVNGGVDGDIAWLAFVERGRVEFVSDPVGVERRWDLRVTEVFRRSNDAWQRLHRHADPLVDRRSIAEAATYLS